MDTRRTLTAALWASALFGAGLVFPLLGQALALFAPVPLIMAYAGSGRRDGLAALGISSLFVFILFGWSWAALFVLIFGLMAIGTAEGMMRRFKPERAALLGGLLPVAVLGLAVGYYAFKTGRNPMAALEGFLKASMIEGAKLYTELGLKEAAQTALSVSDSVIYYIVRFMPAIVAATAVTQAACCYVLARVLIKRRGLAADMGQGSFAEWHAPDSWVWGLIAALALVAVPSHDGRIIGWNLTILFIVVYTIQGLALAEYAMKRVAIAAAARAFILVLILALPVNVLLTALGVVDIWADFRKLRAGGSGQR